MIKSRKWIRRYLDLAEHISGWSKDPSTKVGAVVIGEDGEVLAQGYNGFPRGVKDSVVRLEDRELKYQLVVHAELNCIYHAARIGLSLKNSTMFISGLPPCNECAKGLIQAGINTVFVLADKTKVEWLPAYHISQQMFQEAGVKCTVYNL